MTDAERIAREFEKLMEEAERLNLEVRINPINAEGWMEGAGVSTKDNRVIIIY